MEGLGVDRMTTFLRSRVLGGDKGHAIQGRHCFRIVERCVLVLNPAGDMVVHSVVLIFCHPVQVGAS